MTGNSAHFTQKSLKVMCLSIIGGLLLGLVLSPLVPVLKFKNASCGQFADYGWIDDPQPTLTVRVHVSRDGNNLQEAPYLAGQNSRPPAVSCTWEPQPQFPELSYGHAWELFVRKWAADECAKRLPPVCQPKTSNRTCKAVCFSNGTKI